MSEKSCRRSLECKKMCQRRKLVKNDDWIEETTVRSNDVRDNKLGKFVQGSIKREKMSIRCGQRGKATFWWLTPMMYNILYRSKRWNMSSPQRTESKITQRKVVYKKYRMSKVVQNMPKPIEYLSILNMTTLMSKDILNCRSRRQQAIKKSSVRSLD